MIRYFDLGVWTGYQTDIMLKVLSVFDKFEIYGIEATKESYAYAKRLYSAYKNVHMYNFAINGYEGVCRLYHAVKKPSGNSIYDSKKNVNINKWEDVKCMRFSKWISNNFDTLDDSFNILKYNIEGAELELFRDMNNENLFSKFDIIVGNSGGDIKKCSEIAGNIDEFYDICKQNNIPLDHRINWKDEDVVYMWRKKIGIHL